MPCSGAELSDVVVIPEKSKRIRVLLMAVFVLSRMQYAHRRLSWGPISNSLIPLPVVFSAVLLNAMDVTNWQATRLIAIPRTRGVPLRDLPQLFSSDAVVG